MLDNTVGGSLRSGESPIDSIVRDAQEEVSLDPLYTRANVKSCGTLSYQMTCSDRGHPGCQFQVQYLYDMEFGQDVVPQIGDPEVEELSLKTFDAVREALANMEFKSICAMTWLAFLLRYGQRRFRERTTSRGNMLTSSSEA